MAQPRGTTAQRLRVAGTFIRIGALNEMQYRMNFFLQVLQSLVALGTAAAVIALVFLYTSQLGGWQPYELLVVLGIHVALGGVIQAIIQPNMQRLMDDIREGKLDHLLLKPEDAQLLVSVRQFSLWKLVDVVLGLGVVAFAMSALREYIGWLQAVGFTLTILLGGVIIYCFWLIITTGAFWVVRMEQVAELFNGLYQAGRWPTTLYPGWLRVGFTVLVPLAFAITVPAQALTARIGIPMLLVSVGFTVVLVAVTRWFWRLGLKNYSGASA